MKKIVFIVAIALSCFKANAQEDSTKQKGKWGFLIEPYLMFPNMNGNVGLGSLPEASVSADPGDIFSHLQMGAMLYFEAHNNKWAVTSDLLYMKLKQDISPNKLINSGKVTAKQTVWELAGLYKINSWFEAGAGARLYSISPDLEINYKNGLNSDSTRLASLTKTWVDPIIVTRFKFFTKTKWTVQHLDCCIRREDSADICCRQPGKKFKLNFPDYNEKGDVLSISVDKANQKIMALDVSTSVDDPGQKVVFNITYTDLPDGTQYAGTTTLDAQTKQVKIVIVNSGYKKAAGQ